MFEIAEKNGLTKRKHERRGGIGGRSKGNMYAYITKVRHHTKIKEPKNLDLILASLIRKS